MDQPVQSSHGKDETRATRSVAVDGQLSAPLDALSDTSTSTTETIPVSCANATDFFNSLLEVVRRSLAANPPIRDRKCNRRDAKICVGNSDKLGEPICHS
jgi:hypothetical protein